MASVVDPQVSQMRISPCISHRSRQFVLLSERQNDQITQLLPKTNEQKSRLTADLRASLAEVDFYFAFWSKASSDEITRVAPDVPPERIRCRATIPSFDGPSTSDRKLSPTMIVSPGDTPSCFNAFS